MDGNNFLKFNNGKEIDFDNFKSEIKKSDFGNKKLKKLFNLFDTNKDGKLSTDEIKSLAENIKQAASANNKSSNSIFDNSEIETFIENNFAKGIKLVSLMLQAFYQPSSILQFSRQKILSLSRLRIIKQIPLN